MSQGSASTQHENSRCRNRFWTFRWSNKFFKVNSIALQPETPKLLHQSQLSRQLFVSQPILSLHPEAENFFRSAQTVMVIRAIRRSRQKEMKTGCGDNLSAFRKMLSSSNQSSIKTRSLGARERFF
jgi:hypothetical protein